VHISRSLQLNKFFLVLVTCLLSTWAPIQAQIAATDPHSLEPGTKPPDAPLEWKQIVGIYGPQSSSIIILERNQKLIWLAKNHESTISPDTANKKNFLLPDANDFSIDCGPSGMVCQIKLSGSPSPLARTDAGSDSAQFFRVTPTKSLDQLHAEALLASPPVEPGPFRKPDLVELTSLSPTFHLDIRYAQSNNFLSTPIYTQARAFMQRPAAEALVRVLNRLQPLGYGLLIHDAYRPWYVTKIFWDATPPTDHIFVADPQKGSKHNRGCAVDLTLYDLSTGQPIEMPGLYDEMSPRSFPTFPGGTSLQRWHRDLLRHAMESEGFTVNEEEWWHFDYKDWKHYPILNLPFEKLGQGSALNRYGVVSRIAIIE
jgi:D-alanyl-D-alanine dipeptidase